VAGASGAHEWARNQRLGITLMAVGAPAALVAPAGIPVEAARDDFPRLGITLAGIRSFVASCGGDGALAGRTTSAICCDFVKPRTAAARLSYCELGALAGDGEILPATVFVSHAWAYCFLDLLAALEHEHAKATAAHASAAPPPVFWFDIFSVNQHEDSSARPFSWWTDTFYGAVRGIAARSSCSSGSGPSRSRAPGASTRFRARSRHPSSG